MSKFKKIFTVFDVKDEKELEKKLDNESKTLTCIKCKKEFLIESMRYIDGDPYCQEDYYANV